MVRYSGKGWHFQTTRHSNARKYGKAGGVYSKGNWRYPKDVFIDKTSPRIRTILEEHPEYKSLSFKQLRGKGIFLKYQADTDKDGVKNIKDCQPLNPKKQDEEEIKLKPIKGTKLMRELTTKEKKTTGEKARETAKKVGTWAKKEAKTGYERTKEFVKKEVPKVKSFVKKEAKAIKEKIEKEYEDYKRKRREAIGRAVAQATQQKILDEQTNEEREELINKIETTPAITEMQDEETPTNYQELNISHVFSQLKPEEAQRIAEQTTKALTKAEHKKIEDLADVDAKELSDEELKIIAIRLGTGFFGQGNKFESEIKRRIRERERVETDLTIELKKAQLESKKRLEQIEKDLNKEEKGGYIWDDIFGTKK